MQTELEIEKPTRKAVHVGTAKTFGEAIKIAREQRIKNNYSLPVIIQPADENGLIRIVEEVLT